MIDRRALIAGAVAVLVAPPPPPLVAVGRDYWDGLYAKLRIEMEKVKREKAAENG